MKCPLCGHQDAEGARFCGVCGSRSDAVEYSGFGVRLAAALADTLAIILGMIAAAILFVIVIPWAVGFLDSGIAFGTALASTLPLWFPWLYYISLPLMGHQTVGSEWRGIEVVRSDGRPLDTRQLVLRETIKFAPFSLLLGFFWATGDPRLLGLFGVLLLLGFLMISMDAKRQGWHDKIVRTHVIKARVQPL